MMMYSKAVCKRYYKLSIHSKYVTIRVLFQVDEPQRTNNRLVAEADSILDLLAHGALDKVGQSASGIKVVRAKMKLTSVPSLELLVTASPAFWV